MSTTPKISVIIPCYNAERYIVSAISSVLAQNWPNLEIVVVDDGSSDRSAELICASFPEVRLVQQRNQGIAVARNHGIACAQGDWIAFLDADDVWLPGKLQAQWDTLSAVPGARMCHTAFEFWTSTEPSPEPAFLAALQSRSGDRRRWFGVSGWIYPQLLLDCAVWTSTVLVHRSVFSEVGQFDQSLRIGEDYDLWLRISRVTQILHVAFPYALYRRHSTSITRSIVQENHRDLVINRALARWGYRSPDGSRARKADVDRALANTWTEFACLHLAAGNFIRARQAALTALRIDMTHAKGWKVLISTFAGSLFSHK